MSRPKTRFTPKSARSGFVYFVAAGALIFGLCSTRAESAQMPLTRTVPSVVTAHQAAFVANAPAGTAMHLVVSLPLRQPAALKALLHSQIYNPASPMYHHYLTVGQFSAAFSPSERDILTAARFFAARGLTVSGLTPNHLLMDVAGPASAVERVFHIRLGLYRHPTEHRLFIAPDREPTLDLTLPVAQVIGLDNFVVPTPRLVRGPNMSIPMVGSGPNGQYTGSDMRTVYYPSGTLTGAGQSIGLMELGGYNIADVQNFFNSHYGPSNSVSVVGVATDGQPVNCTGCEDSEQALDIEYAISIAPGLSSVRVYVGSIAEDVLNREASDDLSQVLSTSWGWNENFATDDALFQEFAAQGQTNLTASGDYSSLQQSGPWPEEDANIVAVGGTDVVTKTAGGRWSAERAWAHSAGGPSLDPQIPIESYQAPFINQANGGSTTLRNVPDVAANAQTDMQICADGTCFGGNGGTSFASPMWAGIVALANQKAALDGKPAVGFINPAVYALAGGTKYKTLFHDEVKGKSGKFVCTPSYDLVTGLGSPNGQGFINALAAY